MATDTTAFTHISQRIEQLYNDYCAGYPITNDAQKEYVVTCVIEHLPDRPYPPTDGQIYAAIRKARPAILNGTFQRLGQNPTINHAGDSHTIEPQRANELLQIIVNHLKDENGKQKTTDDLAKLGFTKHELTCLGLPESINTPPNEQTP